MNQIIPIDQFISNYKDISLDLTDGTDVGFYVMIQILQEIYNLTKNNNILIGTYKETQKYGDTSVSMGVCHQLKIEEDIGILNCGAGGIKYQIYGKRNGYLTLIHKYCPCNGVNLNIISGPKLVPLIEKEMQTISMPKKKIAFITGHLRKKWQDGSTDKKEAMNQEMTSIFQSLNIDSINGNYFMPQTVEGQMEMLATYHLYKNLHQDIEPMITLGIGNGSCQFSIKDCKIIEHTGGMQNINLLMQLPKTVMQELDIDIFNQYEKPLIALKSGSLLRLQKN